MINSQPMGFYAPAQLVRDAREHGVEVRPVDVNHSGWDCTLEQGAGSEEQGDGESHQRLHSRSSLLAPRSFLRLGLRMLNGLREDAGEAIERARRRRPFHFDRRLRPPHRLGPGGDQAAGRGRCVRLARQRSAAGAVASAGPRKKRRAMPLFETGSQGQVHDRRVKELRASPNGERQ